MDSHMLIKMAVVPTLLLLYGLTFLVLFIPTKNSKVAALGAVPVDVVIMILLAPTLSSLF